MVKRNPFADDEVTRPDPLQAAQARLERYAAEIERYSLDIKQLDVVESGSAALMTSKLGLVRQAIKAVDEERRGIIFDADKFVRTVNSWAKALKDRLESVLRVGEPKLKTFTYQLELKRREEEKAMQDALRKRQAEMDRAAKKAGVETVQLPTAVLPVEREKIVADTASVSYKPVWVAEIINPDEVPREYCSPDQKKIDAAVAGGIRSIAGCSIKEEMKSTWRAR